MPDKVKIEMYARTDVVGSKVKRTIDVDKEQWDQYSETEKEEYMRDEFFNSAMIDWGWEEKR